MGKRSIWAGAASALGFLALVLPGAATAAESAPPFGQWQPGPHDTCSKKLHDSYSVIGPDGLRYPAWHPPEVTDPKTGKRCTFGHEHGRNPVHSDLYGWVSRHLAADGREGRAGVPFGAANVALDEWAAAHPGMPTRQEDHVGHKVEWENDAILYKTVDGQQVQIGIRCDFLTKIHQGTHSADAFGNNVHELLYAVRCTDGTKLIATKLVTFGAANEFVRSCDKETVLAAGTSHTYPAGGGVRLIPDRACAEEHVLVPEGLFSEYSLGLYEDWISSNYLRTADGTQIAYFDPHFAVFNPSRFAGAGAALERSAGLCREVEPNGDRARGGACEALAGPGPETPFDDPASPFDGAHREVYFNQTTVENAGGPRHWWTDPYGGNASEEPFPGAICQLVGSSDNTSRPTLESQAFGASRDYGGRGVHAPN